MKAGSWINTAAVFLVVAFPLTSCVGTRNTQTAKPDQEKQVEQALPVKKLTQKYDNILLSSFTIKPEFAKDYPDAAKTLQKSMLAALQEEKSFKNVSTTEKGKPDKGNTLRITADITNMRIVSDSARIWGGGFAGSSGIELDLKLIDAATGKVVRSEKMSSWNNAWAASWSFGSSDHSLLNDMGKILAKYVVDSMPKK